MTDQLPPDPTIPPPGVTVLDTADYRLVLTLTHDGFLSMRHKMNRAELADQLLRIRDAVITAPGINPTHQIGER